MSKADKIYRKDRNGFSLLETIVAISILAALAAIALPTFLGHTQTAKATQTQNNIAAIGSRLVYAYGEVMYDGDASSSSAIATFNENLPVRGLLETDTVVFYGDGSQVITWQDLFPSGLPKSPFNGTSYQYAVSPKEGKGTYQMQSGVMTLTIQEFPSITIRDSMHQNILQSFTP